MIHAFLFGPWPVVLSATTLLALIGTQVYLVDTLRTLAEIDQLADLPVLEQYRDQQDPQDLAALAQEVRRRRLLLIAAVTVLSIVTAQVMVLRVFPP